MKFQLNTRELDNYRRMVKSWSRLQPRLFSCTLVADLFGRAEVYRLHKHLLAKFCLESSEGLKKAYIGNKGMPFDAYEDLYGRAAWKTRIKFYAFIVDILNTELILNSEVVGDDTILELEDV